MDHQGYAFNDAVMCMHDTGGMANSAVKSGFALLLSCIYPKTYSFYNTCSLNRK